MFATQWSRQEEKDERVHEITGNESMVVKTPVRGNSERLAQMMLAGQYVEAERIGYEYGPEDIIPEEISYRPGKSADPVEILKFVESFGRRIRESARKVAEDAAKSTGLRKENENSSKSQSGETREGVQKDENSGNNGGQSK